MEWTGRARVRAALAHQHADRVPIDLGGTRATGIAATTYQELRRHLGLPEVVPKVYDVPQQLVVVEDDVRDALGVDTVDLTYTYCQRDSDWHRWQLTDGSPSLIPKWFRPTRVEGAWELHSESGRVVGRMPDGFKYFEQCYWPLSGHPGPYTPEVMTAASRECFADLSAIPPGPFGAGEEGLQLLKEGAMRLRERTQRFIVAPFWRRLLETGQRLFGIEEMLEMFARHPSRAHAVFDALLLSNLQGLERLLTAVGPYIDAVVFGEDLGTQRGPQISTRTFQEFLLPRWKQMFSAAKRHAPNAAVILHSCGGIRPLIPHLIDAGVDALNPVQISARGMDPAGLKTDFGDRLTFWGGGCDTQQVLPRGTPEEVKAHSAANVRALSQGGGEVFATVHNILADVPPANIMAMYDGLREGQRPPDG